MVEQAGYPYVEGSHGIPFFAMEEGESLEIIGGSGQVLSYYALPDTLYVFDPQEVLRNSLLAIASNGKLLLTLFPSPDGLHDTPRHPDLYAKRFIDVALAHFKKHGIKIDKHVSDWPSWTENYRQYERLIAQGADDEYAVNHTWIGKTLKERGFLPAVASDIQRNSKTMHVTYPKEA